ncbi:DUF4112 domain-containing protein [Salinirubellus salinus]|uniref:DUF4112 domain-containing protein n=1 Tax=Salinirubellus salinus TaxID=1364945 RepID=A0A9E7R361_9EURY|nr:DUF4112 domain-containing protein [Salinirubellus salinus]UWM54935.1 DUF4112 domain-containing protein [Salinirubellus salinus]
MTHHDFDTAFVDGFEGELPESLDEAAVERMRAVAKLLDEQVEIPGTGFRVGLDPLVSAVPGVGSAVGAVVSLYIVAEAAYLGVSFSTVLRMLANVVIDAVGGSIPYVGVLFDAVWKTNKRNLRLALEDLTEGVEHETTGVVEVGGHEEHTEATEDEGDDGPVVIEVE